MTESTLDQVLAELNDLQRRMSELPDDAFAERVMVRERRRELHAQAAELRGASRSLEGLQKELQDLRRLRDEVFDRHLSIGNIGAGGGEGGGGVEVRYVNEVNRTIDEAGALSRINRQIRELEVELGRRLQSGEGSWTGLPWVGSCCLIGRTDRKPRQGSTESALATPPVLSDQLGMLGPTSM